MNYHNFLKSQVSFIIKLFLLTGILFFIHFYILEYLVKSISFFHPLWLIYFVHFFLVYVVYGILSYLFFKGKKEVFNTFIVCTMLKMVLIIVFLLPVILSELKSKIPDVLNFFLPYFVFLSFEVFYITKLLKKK